MKFPEIDKEQALRQLELLGNQENDPIFFRFFYPSDDPRKNSDKGRKSDRLNWKQIEAYQKQGRGVYFVINGGGHKNSDVTEGQAFFIEHDHLPKEVQRELWKQLGLPEPSLQIDTGGKSLHNYWIPLEPVPIEQWSELQKDLLEYTDADRSIKNASRVMRLAGGWHHSFDDEGNPVHNQSRIVGDSGKKYSYEELRAAVPKRNQNAESRNNFGGMQNQGMQNQGMQNQGMQNAECRMQNGEIQGTEAQSNNGTGSKLGSKQPESSSDSAPQHLSPSALMPLHPDEIEIPVPLPIPLLECCRKEVREWVNTGVPQGQKRNDTAINVGMELVGKGIYNK